MVAKAARDAFAKRLVLDDTARVADNVGVARQQAERVEFEQRWVGFFLGQITTGTNDNNGQLPLPRNWSDGDTIKTENETTPHRHFEAFRCHLFLHHCCR